jgi:subtilisin family serine protease
VKIVPQYAHKSRGRSPLSAEGVEPPSLIGSRRRLAKRGLRVVAGLAFASLLFPQEPPAASQEPLEVVSVSADMSSGPAHHPSRVIVRFRNGPSFLPDAANGRALGGGVFVVDNPPGLSVADAVRNYHANPNVVYVEPDYTVSTTTNPTDPLWSQQWDMVKINAPGAWNTQTSASDVIVAVIDTGIDFTHADLQANLWTNPANGSHGFTCMNGVCASGGQDDYGHGTHVAGTIGAIADNGIGIAGINWRTQMLACKFLGSNGSGSTSDAVLCFNQILGLKQQGLNIRVTSNSWGGGGYSQALKDAMDAVESAGIVNVCAAGNSGVNADIAPMYPGAFDNRGLVSVLASDQNDLGASFTNYGMANVDIAAPGVSTLSTVPTGTCPLCDPSGYKLLSGTSMATPHVSAVLAAMFHLHPALTAYQARDALLDPASYDLLTDPRGGMTSTGGRLNFLKAITNPILSAPKLNSFPVITGVSNAVANSGDPVNLTATASDPDDDPLRMAWARGPFNSAPGATSLWLFGWMLNTIFPAPSGSSLSFQAPALARPAMAPYAVSAADGRGGGASALAYATILPAAAAGQPPSGSLTVSPATGPVGTVVSVGFPAVDPEGGPVGWDLWQTGAGGGFGWCCQTGPSFNVPINQAGAYRITVQAIDSELNFSNRQSAVVRIGGATGTPPIANAVFDKLTGTAPLTVNIDMSASFDPDGTVQQYLIECQHGASGVLAFGPTGSCQYDTPGNYWILLQVTDNNGLGDVLSAYAVVTPPGSAPPPGSSKTPASVTLGNLTQTYTGSPLVPSAATNPAGLAITWSNAPQTKAGGYAVTATVNDPNYQGSASGTFTINKAAASVALSNLSQTYTGGALAPAAATNPAGLAITWTNAPQTKAGSYAVTATVNDPNYQGSASGTFSINKAAASVALSNMSQASTGGALAPAAATNPAGLAIIWTNAPQTAAGSYTVTATVNDPNYQGSASGTFTINNKMAASVALSNMTQTYAGSALTPAATTNPAGLAIIWTNAPQTKAGSYAVTATVNDPNYQGSASGTFTINKAAASVVLSNMSQTYTGGALEPTATANPPGLAVAWTNAPQSKAGGYAATATVNDPNYQGSASGTFTINKAATSVALSNMTQTYTGGTLTPTATTNPAGLAVAWSNAPQTAAGSYAVTATVNDSNYQGSASGTFTIQPIPPQGTPPTVSITSPLGGTVPTKSTVAILAAAKPGTNPIARVDFLINGSVKCSDVSGPYTCSWTVPSATGKTYQLQAKAYDSLGLAGASSIVTVTSSR